MHEHTFVLNFNVTSEHFKSIILMFYVLYYYYDFSFSYLFFPVLIFRIYGALTWHVYLINLFSIFFIPQFFIPYMCVYMYI